MVPPNVAVRNRSEEHTSELQSRSDLVCRLLLEKINAEESENTRHNEGLDDEHVRSPGICVERNLLGRDIDLAQCADQTVVFSDDPGAAGVGLVFPGPRDPR